jgi:hypothetical protein
MDFHSLEGGVHLTVRWKDEREYQLASAFLQDLLGEAPPSTGRPDEIPTYYVQNDKFFDALFAFQRRLRGSTEK